jgi:hypothetical protein
MSNNLQQQLPYRPVPQQQGIPTAPPLQTALNRPQCAFPTIPGKRKKDGSAKRRSNGHQRQTPSRNTAHKKTVLQSQA